MDERGIVALYGAPFQPVATDVAVADRDRVGARGLRLREWGATTAAGSGEKASPAVAASATGTSAAVAPKAQPQMIRAAEAVCRRLNTEIAPVASSKPPSPAELGAQLLRTAARERRALAELASLTPPATLVRAWHKVLASRGSLATELVMRRPRAFRLKKRAHYALRSLASGAGFVDCAQLG